MLSINGDGESVFGISGIKDERFLEVEIEGLARGIDGGLTRELGSGGIRRAGGDSGGVDEDREGVDLIGVSGVVF